jgi:hypothetical protein
MRELPDRQRGALVMRELAGLGFEEIGAALDTSPAVARQTLYEARLGLRQMQEGREMSCDSVTRALSDDDGRVIRRRDLRAHLRHCPRCREFRDELRHRRSDLAAIAPLPAAAAAGILQTIFGAGGPGGGGLPGAIGGGAAKVFGTSAAVKSAATVAVVATIGVTAADRGGLIDAGLPGGDGSRPAQTAPQEPGAARETAAQLGAGSGRGGAIGGPVSATAELRAVARAAAMAARRAAAGDAPLAVPAGGVPGASGEHRNDSGRHGTLPAASTRGQETAASHIGAAGAGSRGGASQSHPAHPTKPAHMAQQPKPGHTAVAPSGKNRKSVAPATAEAEKPAGAAGHYPPALPAEANE